MIPALDDSHIHAVSPPGPSFTKVDVLVTGAGGTSDPNASDQYLFMGIIS